MFGDDYHRSLEHIGGAGGERRQGDRGTDIAVASCCRSPSILAHGSGRGNLAPWWWLRFKEPPVVIVFISYHNYHYFVRSAILKVREVTGIARTVLVQKMFAQPQIRRFHEYNPTTVIRPLVILSEFLMPMACFFPSQFSRVSIHGELWFGTVRPCSSSDARL
jgi:hypothetical protein